MTDTWETTIAAEVWQSADAPGTTFKTTVANSVNLTGGGGGGADQDDTTLPVTYAPTNYEADEAFLYHHLAGIDEALTGGGGGGGGGPVIVNISNGFYEQSDLFIDGLWSVAPAGTRVILTGQTNPAENGVYLCDGTDTLVRDTAFFPSTTGAIINVGQFDIGPTDNSYSRPGVTYIVDPGRDSGFFDSPFYPSIDDFQTTVHVDPDHYVANNPYLYDHLHGIDLKLGTVDEWARTTYVNNGETLESALAGGSPIGLAIIVGSDDGVLPVWSTRADSRVHRMLINNRTNNPLSVTTNDGSTELYLMQDGETIEVMENGYGDAPKVLSLANYSGGGGGAALSDATPADLGTATPGTSDEASRSDHVHDLPTPADIGTLDTAGIASLAGGYANDAESHSNTYTDSAVSALSTVYQPLDSDLTAIAALTTTTYGRALLALADAAAGRTALGLGTAATQASTAFDTAGAAAAAQAASQPLDSDLTAIAALTTTTFGRALLAMADAAATRTALGLGTAATTATTAYATAAQGAKADTAVQPAALAALSSTSTFSNTNYTVLSTDRRVIQTGTMSALRTVTLPSAATVAAGTAIVLIDRSGTVTQTNALSVSIDTGTFPSDRINGVADLLVTEAYAILVMYSDGSTKWTATSLNGIAHIVNTDGNVGHTIFVGSVTPTGPLTGDVWIAP